MPHANAQSTSINKSISTSELRNLSVTTQQRAIVHMCRESVPIDTCLRRLANWCLSNGVDISEGGSKLKAEFRKPMLVAY